MQRILYGSTTLASNYVSLARIGPFDLAFNGQPVLDVAQFINADNATVYGRGDGPVDCSFSVHALFNSHAEALQFAALHREQLLVQDDLQIVDDDLGVTLVLAAAVREVHFVIRGSAVIALYKFTGAKFTTTGEAELTADSDTVKATEIPLSINDETVVWTFAAPFLSKPRKVHLDISAPAGGVAIFAIPRESTRSTTGITFDLTQKIPATGYVGLGLAVL